jgi:hypothetical protein
VLHRRWRGRPSGRWASAVALQGETANHRKVRRLRAEVLSVAEKARDGARQVWAKKASASEPLMTCRKLQRGRRNRVWDLGLGSAWGIPAYCPGAVRHEGGASLARASVWNTGTCRPAPAGGQWRSDGLRSRVEGRSPSGRPARGRVPMRGTGADRLVVAMRPGNAGGATGAGHLGLLVGQP